MNAEISNKPLPSLIALTDARSGANQVRREDLDLLLCQRADCTTHHLALRQKGIEAYRDAVKTYESGISYPGERELYQLSLIHISLPDSPERIAFCS